MRDRHEGRQTHYSAQLSALAPLINWTSEMAMAAAVRRSRRANLLERMDRWCEIGHRNAHCRSGLNATYLIRRKSSGARSRNPT